MKKIEKPRVRFCWECGKKLWGNHHVKAKLKIDQRERILHRQCFDLNKEEFLKEEL